MIGKIEKLRSKIQLAKQLANWRMRGQALLKVLDVKFNVPELVDHRIIFNSLR